jgi:hypothetical protein
VATFRERIAIERSLEDVFAVLTDVERTARWSAAAESERWLTPPPHGLGSRREAVTRGMGRRMTNVAEVTAFEPLRTWTMRSISGPPFEVTATFTGDAHRTHVDFTWILGHGSLQRLLLRPFVPLFRRPFVTDLGRLKAMMETGEL